ncbi:hypothetical protein MTR_4g071265 [Medicago truncatula]|uniref:Uncharacterized protein n=1 Tax=Medicago truncatula TaxID=3880 RepID=A0A072UL39_MEDTR|nr:hypothetical protein MTR_4g071265 [Medicago truncatula]
MQPSHFRPSPITKRATKVSLPEEHKTRGDLQGLALTLGGSASGNHDNSLLMVKLENFTKYFKGTSTVQSGN